MQSRRWWNAGVALGVIALAWIVSTRVGGLDLAVYRRAAQALLDGRDPFATSGDQLPFVYPPFSAALFVPMALVSSQVALFAMTALSLGAVWLVVRRCSDHLWPVPTAITRRATLAVLLVLAVSDPVLVTLRWGQINLVLMAMIVADLVRPRESRFQGVLIGLAAGIKLVPGLFILYLIVTRRFRAAAVATATFVATVAVGAVVLPEGSMTFWFGGSATDPSRFPVPTIANQSLLGTFARLTGAEGTTGWWLLLALPVVALATWLAVRAADRFGELAGISVVGLATCLVSPIGWNHYFAWFALPLFLLVRLALDSRTKVAAGLAVAWAVPFVATPIWWLPEALWSGRDLSTLQALRASTYTLVCVVAMATLVVVVLRSRRMVELPDLVELVDLRLPVSSVVTRPAVMRRAHVPFDPFDPPPTVAAPHDAVVAAAAAGRILSTQVTGPLAPNLPSPN